MEEAKRVLCLVSSMNAGGAETFLMKVYRKLDKTKYQMDFCVNSTQKGFYDDEIREMGGKIFTIPSKSENLEGFRAGLSDVVRSNRYKRVFRITSNAMGFLDLKIAKDSGAKRCIARSSNSSDGGGLNAWAAHRLGRLLYSRYVDVKIAPSDLAAKYTFGNNAYENGSVSILHNAIDIEKYGFNAEARRTVRAEFRIPDDTMVLGHVGRLTAQKNHEFLLDVFSKYAEKNENSVLLLVGRGELESAIKKKASELGVADKVIFAGIRSDVPAVLSAMDVFVFPSLYEGMPNTVIEAQATALPCVIADTITREADITGLVHYLPLGDADMWASYIERLPSEERTTPAQEFRAKGYDIETVTGQFVKLIFQ